MARNGVVCALLDCYTVDQMQELADLGLNLAQLFKDIVGKTNQHGCLTLETHVQGIAARLQALKDQCRNAAMPSISHLCPV